MNRDFLAARRALATVWQLPLAPSGAITPHFSGNLGEFKTCRRDSKPTEEDRISLDLKGRISELDGIRGIAIGMVLMHHYFFQPIEAPPGTALSYVQAAARLGWSGVDLFFVLSGFLIGGILLDARTSSNYFAVFYTRRFFRIVPIYFVFLTLTFCVYALGRLGITSDFQWIFQYRIPWFSYPLFLQNFWMAVTTSFGALGLTVTWSLAVEEQFYLTLPTLVRFLRARDLALTLASGIILAPVSRILLHAFAPSHFLSWYTLMPCRADALLLGVVGAMLLRSEVWSQRLIRSRRLLLLLIAALGIGLAVLTVRAPDPYGYGMLAIGYSWLALFYLSVILCGLLYCETWFGAFLRWGWLRWLGSIAYGAYLFHEIIRHTLLGLLSSGIPRHWSPRDILVSCVALSLTLLLCRLSWKFFEKPLIQLGHRAHYEGTQPQAVGSVLSPGMGRNA
jgi:peptidoglycan/LPS O-acetylase OafA/YrhL